MSNSAYWNSQYNYYMSNKPPEAESYYNKSFVDRINEAQKNIDTLVAEKDKAWSATEQKQDDYKAFQGTMSSYNDVYTNSKSEFGIEEHQDNYEKSKKALALAESTLSALPSSINNSSNRVLTQSQREARYNTLSNKYMSYRDNLMARTSAYEEVWKSARESQAAYASAEIASQYSKLEAYNNAYVTAMNNYLEAEKKLTNANLEKKAWEGQYRDWQHQQQQNEYLVWFNNMSNALDRYKEALKTDAVLAQTNKKKTNADNYLKNSVKSWDFGNGYTMRGVVGGNATYLHNGETISAGRFVEATGANGAKWDLWNDVWGSGVRTRGVGSDTVEAFNHKSSADSRFNFLFY